VPSASAGIVSEVRSAAPISALIKTLPCLLYLFLSIVLGSVSRSQDHGAKYMAGILNICLKSKLNGSARSVAQSLPARSRKQRGRELPVHPRRAISLRRKLVWGIWCQALNGDAISFSIRHRIAAARGMTTGGELATGRHSSRHKLVCGRSLRIGTMMQPCASAAKFRSGGSILHSGLTAMLTLGAPPPRIVIGPPLSRLERAQNAV
jgi:hypothetical protein